MSQGTRSITAQLARLQSHNPQTFGSLQQHWNEAKAGLDNTDRNYARVKQIRTNISDPDVSTRSLGNTLTLLAKIDVIEIYTNRNNATIYDLTGYQPGLLATVGRVLNNWSATRD